MLNNRPVVIQFASLEVVNYLGDLLSSANIPGDKAILHATAQQNLGAPEFTDLIIERLKKEITSAPEDTKVSPLNPQVVQS